MGEQPGAKLKKSTRDLKIEVHEEMRYYKCMGGVSFHQANAVRIIFDLLVWWGEQRYSFPILSHVAQTIIISYQVQNRRGTSVELGELHVKIKID